MANESISEKGIATFEPIRLTRRTRIADQSDIEIGQNITETVEPNETIDERKITFRA